MAIKADTTIEKRYLKCVLTEDEKRQIAADMAQAVSVKNALENEKKSFDTQINADIKKAEATISSSAEKIRAGYEMREIDVEVDIDHENGSVTDHPGWQIPKRTPIPGSTSR